MLGEAARYSADTVKPREQGARMSTGQLLEAADESSVSVGSPEPSGEPATSAPAPPLAAVDGTDYAAREDGTCEVAVPGPG